jgi:predicted DNA-binding transcriptional regulator AlpA
MARKRSNKVGVAPTCSDCFLPGLISGPKVRQALDISAVTLWRWRNNSAAGFPASIVINGRLYFGRAEMQAWLAKQQRIACTPRKRNAEINRAQSGRGLDLS